MWSKQFGLLSLRSRSQGSKLVLLVSYFLHFWKSSFQTDCAVVLFSPNQTTAQPRCIYFVSKTRATTKISSKVMGDGSFVLLLFSGTKVIFGFCVCMYVRQVPADVRLAMGRAFRQQMYWNLNAWLCASICYAFQRILVLCICRCAPFWIIYFVHSLLAAAFAWSVYLWRVLKWPSKVKFFVSLLLFFTSDFIKIQKCSRLRKCWL